jgi:hypothetical protein
MERNATPTPENRGARARVGLGFRFVLDFLRNEILTVASLEQLQEP